MASVRVFDTLRERVEKSKGLLPMERRAMFWFRNYSTALTEWQNTFQKRSFSTLQNDTFTKRLVPPKAVIPGCLYFFQYQPYHADTLLYYDRLPLVLPLDRDNDGFLGLNFHYLPYRMRAGFFDLLYSDRLRKTNDPLRTRMIVSYKLLNAVSKYKAFRPCLRRYRYKNCRSGLLQIGETEWDVALFLPVERFAKDTRSNIWNESIREVSELADDIDSVSIE